MNHRCVAESHVNQLAASSAIGSLLLAVSELFKNSRCWFSYALRIIPFGRMGRAGGGGIPQGLGTAARQSLVR